ncbi:coiled-coil protein [Actinidia rufa]|uniref:Splicing factor YJU2 n=1 Tax=Actinidia rufa TaxID=165716 RepID=A0A7J0G3G8_9ERIC|nr:coiled-coil protein [Actinidia rufa]
MGERKVLNKYYPPDFDPAKIPRRRQPKNQQMKVRMMLPMSIRCNTCGNYIYKGTKFNSRKEDVIGETYLGIQIFRFYFKCTKCSAELTMKTDPQNSDYVVESGAQRNFEPWRAGDEEADKEKRKRENEEMGDAMKSLENRTLDSKREMDILAALDEVKSMKLICIYISDGNAEALSGVLNVCRSVFIAPPLAAHIIAVAVISPSSSRRHCSHYRLLPLSPLPLSLPVVDAIAVCHCGHR